MSKKRILGVIGLGHVGAHAAYALAVQGIADELILVDKNAQKLASEVQDLRDAAAYLPHRVTVRAGDFPDLGACDVIVNSVGKIELLYQSHDRLTEMDYTDPRGAQLRTRRSKTAALTACSSTSPIPAISSRGSWRWASGLPQRPRLRHRHGARHVPASQRPGPPDRHRPQIHHLLHARRARQPAVCALVLRQLPRHAARCLGRERTSASALTATRCRRNPSAAAGSRSPASSAPNTASRPRPRAWRIIVLHDEKAIMPASAELCGEYGESGLFAGVPCVIGAGGVEQVVELPLTKEEAGDLPRLLRGHPRQHGASERSVIIRRYHYEHHCYEKSQPRQAPACRSARLRLRFHRPHVPHGLYRPERLAQRAHRALRPHLHVPGGQRPALRHRGL